MGEGVTITHSMEDIAIPKLLLVPPELNPPPRLKNAQYRKARFGYAFLTKGRRGAPTLSLAY